MTPSEDAHGLGGDTQRTRIYSSDSLQSRDPIVDPCDTDCGQRTTCERGAYPIDPQDPNIRSYDPDPITDLCPHKIWRKSLAYTANMKGLGKRHNSHAATHKSHAQRARELGLAVPDLMVKRHIRDGHNIKGGEE